MAEKLYAIVDIETTGGDFKHDRITEIAIAIHDGKQIIDKFESLVNPGRSIPEFITRLTGISNEMVENAPHFHEIAKEIVLITENTIFVAHNVGFDYTIVKRHFEELGFTYTRKKLCTAKMARRLLPEVPKHNLSKLIEHFNIKIENRHRAMDDVLATAVVFEKMREKPEFQDTEKEFINFGAKLSTIPKDIDLEYVHNLTEKCGVYFMYGQNDHLLYVGKAKNIKKRIFQHFRSHSKKSFRFLERVKRIDYELTGSEVIALIKEDFYIKTLRPEYNKARRGFKERFAIIIPENGGFPVVERMDRIHADAEILITFPRKKNAEHYLRKSLLESGHCLCEIDMKIPFSECPNIAFGLCSLYTSGHIKAEVKEQKLLDILKNKFERDFILLDQGVNANERSVVMIKEGEVSGYGYLNMDEGYREGEDLADSLTKVKPNVYYNKIVSSHISKVKSPQIHYLKKLKS